MGNPDIPTPKHIVDKLVETSQDTKMHRYSASRGITGLRKANAKYYERRFNVKLDYDKEIIATIGSKEGLANMAQVLASPGDTIMVPNPAYPIHAFGFIISGANLIHYRINDEIDFCDRLVYDLAWEDYNTSYENGYLNAKVYKDQLEDFVTTKGDWFLNAEKFNELSISISIRSFLASSSFFAAFSFSIFCCVIVDKDRSI